MRAAADMLVRALVNRGPCCVLTAAERLWASVTFTGAHHTLRLVIAADETAGFLEGIEEAEFDLGEHLLADIVVAESVILGERRMVLIEALTIERADVFPPTRTRGGAKRATEDDDMRNEARFCAVGCGMSETNLCYVDDALPGITRRKAGHGWAYSDAKGKRITHRDEIDRLNAIALPPAYRDAWFCPSPHGHIQATGIDDKGRKQYRYHIAFRAQQDAQKYEKCADFGRALPLLRARVAEDLASRKLDKDTVVAAVVRLLDLGHIRVGNEAYAKQNRSFGATTLRNRHAQVKGARLKLAYMGKSGKKQQLTIEDRRLAALVKKTQDLPGQHLFEYLDSEGVPHPVGSGEVNDYIREATGGAFTAKHFRTWGASLLAFEHILETAQDSGKIALKPMLERVAASLGNTPAISRKSYVHPALIELCRTGDATGLCELKLPRATKWMRGPERALIAFLDEIASLERKAAKAQAKAA